MNPEYLTGCLQPDVLRFSAVPAFDEACEVLPESEWMAHDDFGPICDTPRQQKNNNCTNASLAQLMQVLLRAQGEPSPLLSMSYLYSRYNGGRDAGAYCRQLALGAKEFGMPTEALFPSTSIYAPRGGYPQIVLEDGKKRTVFEVYQCQSWSDVCSALTRRFLVYHGYVLGNAFFKTGKDGRVPEYDGQFANGHAMFSRGLTREFGDLRTITVNSWGPSFGDGGVCYVPKSYYWAQSGQYVNLDAYAIRAIKQVDMPQM